MGGMKRPAVAAWMLALTVAIGCKAADAPKFGGEPPALTITFVGDTGQGSVAEKFVEEHGYRHSFTHLRPLWAGSDFVVANMEMTIGVPEPGKVNDQRPFQKPEAAAAYAQEGVTAVSLGNNHAMDYGAAGLASTLANLDAAGIRHFGAGMNEAEARRPLILEKNGVRVALLGYCQDYSRLRKEDQYAGPDKPGVALMSAEHMREDIAAARALAGRVVVVLHWVANYQRLGEKAKGLARQAAEAGADIVVGSGPHVVWPVETIAGRPVLYSIGNFIWHNKGLYRKYKIEDRAYGLMASVGFSKERVTGIALRAINTDNREVKYMPRPVEGAEARRLFDDLLADAGPNVTIEDVGATIRP
jgi:poly-gamma-glutamate synthesis protein (capsule biosynthesis protein)